MWGVPADGNADWKVLARPGEIRTPLVASPVKKQFLGCNPPAELNRMLSERGQEYVIRLHDKTSAKTDGFLAERRGVGTESVGALEGNGFRIKGARQHHLPIQALERLRVRESLRQLRQCDPFRIQEGRILDFEAGDARHAYDPFPVSSRGKPNAGVSIMCTCGFRLCGPHGSQRLSPAATQRNC
jgi:hypothetical protein